MEEQLTSGADGHLEINSLKEGVLPLRRPRIPLVRLLSLSGPVLWKQWSALSLSILHVRNITGMVANFCNIAQYRVRYQCIFQTKIEMISIFLILLIFIMNIYDFEALSPDFSLSAIGGNKTYCEAHVLRHSGFHLEL